MPSVIEYFKHYIRHYETTHAKALGCVSKALKVGPVSIQTATTLSGLNFRRSDGMRFFMVYQDDGSAVLYAGVDADTPPQTTIVSLDANVSEKRSEAQR